MYLGILACMLMSDKGTHPSHVQSAPLRCGDYHTELCKLKYIRYENMSRKFYLVAQVAYGHGIEVVVVHYKIGEWINNGIGINLRLVSNN